MCTICMMTQTFDPSRHEGGPESDVVHSLDTGALTPTEIGSATSISVDSSTPGTVDVGGEQDFFAVTFTAGETYTISALGLDSGVGSLDDTDLHLYDSNGNYITYNDGSGVGWDAILSHTATTTGTYYIMVDSYYSTASGTYTLNVEETVPLPPPGTTGTYQELAEYLQSGNTNGVEYTFNTTSSNQITVDISGLTAAGQQLALWAMEAWEMVANIDFVVQYDGQGNEMITVDDEDSGAFAYYPNTGSTSILGGDNTNGVELNVSQQWLINNGTTIDSYSFQTYVHEFGHALGLNHLGDYNFTPGQSITYANDAYFTNDSWQVSVMSYFSQTENTSTNATYGYLAGPMIADILAIQDFYGAPGASTATAGNTTWGLNSNLGNYMDEVFTALATQATSTNIAGNAMVYTLYDQGGTDLLDLSFLTSTVAADINLNGGMFSSFGTSIDILGIAVGTVIENLKLGAGGDTAQGNAANNNINGGVGFDFLFGALGNDTLIGGWGNDTLIGGNGNDVLNGGGNNDAINGGNQNDRVYAGNGNDYVEGGNGRDLVFLGNGNDVFYDNAQGGWLGADRVFGNNGNDNIQGGGGNDSLHGGNNNDTVAGGADNDFLTGGAGFDTIYAGTGNDAVEGGMGRDKVFLGTGNDTFTDSDQGGYWGTDRVFGGTGNDVFNIMGGNDVLSGGADSDTFYFIGDDIDGNTITDFALGVDQLELDDALWGQTPLSVAQVIAQYADDSTGTVIFDFGNGNTITLNGVSSVTGLAADVSIF